MLRVDDEQKKVRTVEIGVCRRTSMQVEWGPCLNLFLIHIVGQVPK
jgi:hypothetical protein